MLSLLLLGYGLKRYNGFDFHSYFDLVKGANEGASVYGVKPLSLYPPPGVYLLRGLQFIPETVAHVAWYLISLCLFFRMSFIGFSLVLSDRVLSIQQFLLFIWISWLAILQGLGAQLEGGNINLGLMYLMFEGLYCLSFERGSSFKLSKGIFLIWFPIFFKPYLGLISLGITIQMLRKTSWKSFILPGALLGLVLLIPLIHLGVEPVMREYKDWLKGDVRYIDCAFTLKCNAVNYSLTSYFYHIHQLKLEKIFVITGLLSFLAMGYSFFEQNLQKLFAALCTLTFLISPASFPYTMMLLWFPILWSTTNLILERQKKGFLTASIPLLFLASIIFLNPTYVGREFFNQVVVPYRVTSFMVAPLLWALLDFSWLKTQRPSVVKSNELL